MKKKSLITLFLIALSLFSQFCVAVSAQEQAEKADSRAQDVAVFSLEECVRFAVYNSFEVQMAKLDLLIAETDIMPAVAVFDTFLTGNIGYTEDKRQELSVFAPDNDQTNVYSVGASKKLPTGTELNATWSDTRTWSDTIFVTKNPAHNAELKLEARQPVGKNLFGYVDRGNVTITELAIMNADLETKDRIEALMADVERAYLNLVFAKKNQYIFERILQKATDLYENDKRSFDIGLLERVDLYNSEANVTRREAELLIAENNYKQAEENLKLIMNMGDNTHLISEEDLKTEPLEKDLSSCLKEAFENRRDYRISKRDVKIKGLDVKLKENMKWPEIDLVGTWAMNGLERKFGKAFGKTTVNDNSYYYAGVEVTIPVENNQARGEHKKAKFEKERALTRLKEVERTIITEVGNAFHDVLAYESSAVFTKKAVDLELKKLNEEEKRYKYGRSSTKRLIDYQQDLLRAALEHTRFVFDQRLSKVNLQRTMNVILKKYEEVL
ncbi:MAG: TolC family protein [Candidatus Omnitrophota bacterium]|jgi:outer membrane protein TolC